MSDASGVRGLIAKILPFSAVDGPGNRSVIFLQGCDFNCKYCHNPETRARCVHCGICVPVCPTNALKEESVPVTEDAPYGLRVSWDPTRCIDCGACLAACPHDSSPKSRLMIPSETLEAIAQYTPFLSGITVSGGECGLQPGYLQALLIASRAAGLPGLVDTNGSADFSMWPALVEAAEGFMLDVKAWDPDEHRSLTGIGNDMVKANLRFLLDAGKLYELRTVVAPTLLDAENTVRRVSAILADQDPSVRYKLIRFRPQGVRAAWRDTPQPDDATMEALAGIARETGLKNVIIV